MQASSLLPECLNNCAVVQCHHCDLGHYGLVLEDGVERDVSQGAVPRTARRRTRGRSAGNGSAATGTPGPQDPAQHAHERDASSLPLHCPMIARQRAKR